MHAHVRCNFVFVYKCAYMYMYYVHVLCTGTMYYVHVIVVARLHQYMAFVAQCLYPSGYVRPLEYINMRAASAMY